MHCYYIILVVAILLCRCFADPVRYDGARVYQFDCPQSLVLFFNTLKKGMTKRIFDFWSFNSGSLMNAVAFVAPEIQDNFEELAKTYNLNYRVLNSNIQLAHDAEKAEMTKRRMQLMSREKGTISVDQYHSMEEIETYLIEIAEVFPDKVKLFEASKTYEGRTVHAVKISKCISCVSLRPSAVVNAGYHAREWLGHSSALYLINEFVHNTTDPKIRFLLDHFDWFFIPVANPDGYVHTMTKDRLWRKTMSRHKGGIGVDMNRNFGYHWGEEKESHDPADDVFAGTGPLSEVETKGLTKFIDENAKNLTIFLDIHAFMQSFLIPWGYTKTKANSYDYLLKGCQNMIEGIKELNGNNYTCGTPGDLLYPVAGSAMDYYHYKGVPLTYSVEVRPFAEGNEMPETVFLASMAAPASMIVPTGQEMLVALYEIGRYYFNGKEH